VLIGLAAGAAGVAYAKVRAALRREEEERNQLRLRFSQMEEELRRLRALLEGAGQKARESSPSSAVAPVAPAGGPQKQDAAAGKGIAPEIRAVIAAAVAAFLGKKVRIRSAKMMQPPYEQINPWSQQGRVFVQASHNLRLRG
jgi:methylmalonyl-CoA carboxyltransferase large subunit